MFELPKRWRPGDDVRNNEHHDASVRAIWKLAGADLTKDVEKGWLKPVLGRVVAAGPKNEADYSDARYWIRVCTISAAGGGVDTATLSLSAEPDPENGNPPVIFTATNLSEHLADVHFLPVGSPVIAYPIYDDGDPATKRWVFIQSPSDFVGWCEITAASQISTNMQWTYTVSTKRKTSTGHAGWTDYITGITAFNAAEYGNGATGLMGNGVTLNGSGYVEGTSLTLGPVATGKGLHRLYFKDYGGLDFEYWFEAPNPLTGDCTPP